MLSTFLLKGCLIGFSIAMPVGPIGLLCMRNTLTYGMTCGMICGLGAACADTIYGALAGFGITSVSVFLNNHREMLQLMGAMFLCYLGVTTILSKPKKQTMNIISGSTMRMFLSTFFLTLTNPLTLFSFAGVFAGLGIGNEGANVNDAMMTTTGVFVGSATWWFILTGICKYFKRKINTKITKWLNHLSGAVIFTFGIIALASI